MEALLAGDSERFTVELEANDAEWRKRARSRQGWSCVFGGPECGHLVFEFESVALCRVALGRGMAVEYDSEIIPRAVYTRPGLDEQPAQAALTLDGREDGAE